MFHVLTVLFVVLKLAEVIDWSWWLVFLPSLIILSWAIVVASVVFFAGMIVAVVTLWKD